MRKIRFHLYLLLGMWLLSAAPSAQQAFVTIGDTLPAITLTDQHGATASIAEDTRLILFAADKDAADLVNAYLSGQTETFLPENRAYFLSDISGMPSLVTRLFALPKMRERPYSILLAYSEESLAALPRKKGMVSVIQLLDGSVQQISFAGNKEELNRLIP